MQDPVPLAREIREQQRARITVMSEDLQLQFERAQDAIGAYIEMLSSALASAESAQRKTQSVDGLAAILWLEEEIRTAGVERAKLFEHRKIPNGLEALVQLFEQKRFALFAAQNRALHLPAAQDPSFLRAVVDAARYQPA
jgi:hypothetical protein